MTILVRIDDGLVLLKNINYLKNSIIEEGVGVVNGDEKLIRFLGNELKLKEITLNNYGYPIIRKDDNTITTLYRIILEFYSIYDEKLKEVLENTKFEINHKNKNKLDNRLENLEIVTHRDNIRHSKGLDYEVILSTEKLLEIQNKSNDEKETRINQEYLSRINGLFHKSMKNNKINEKVVKCCYFSFRNTTSSREYKNSNRCNFKHFSNVKISSNFDKISYK